MHCKWILFKVLTLPKMKVVLPECCWKMTVAIRERKDFSAGALRRRQLSHLTRSWQLRLPAQSSWIQLQEVLPFAYQPDMSSVPKCHPIYHQQFIALEKWENVFCFEP
jgi:hypothetical protein